MPPEIPPVPLKGKAGEFLRRQLERVAAESKPTPTTPPPSPEPQNKEVPIPIVINKNTPLADLRRALDQGVPGAYEEWERRFGR